MVVRIKAQVALEMLIYVSIIMLILAIFIAVYINQERAIFIERVNIDARRVAELISVEIDTALSVGPGYSHRFFLPYYLYGATNYTPNISSEQRRVYVVWDEREYSLPLLTSDIIGNTKKGNNFIKNEDGMIKIE